MEHDKDFSLLRPFDLEAAKAGGSICGAAGVAQRAYISGPDSDGQLCVADENGRFALGDCSYYRMAPLAWVEGRPVYPGDVLWYKFAKTDDWSKVVARDRADEVNWMTCEDNTHRKIACMTWTPPKVKREGWALVQKASVHQLKSEAENIHSLLGEPERWTIVHVEYEE